MTYGLKSASICGALFWAALWAAAAAARISLIFTSANLPSGVTSCKIFSAVILQSGHCGLVVTHRSIHVKQNVCRHGRSKLQSVFISRHIEQSSAFVVCNASMAAWTSRGKASGVGGLPRRSSGKRTVSLEALSLAKSDELASFPLLWFEIDVGRDPAFWMAE